jgi:hypothetical protein
MRRREPSEGAFFQCPVCCSLQDIFVSQPRFSGHFSRSQPFFSAVVGPFSGTAEAEELDQHR